MYTLHCRRKTNPRDRYVADTPILFKRCHVFSIAVAIAKREIFIHNTTTPTDDRFIPSCVE